MLERRRDEERQAREAAEQARWNRDMDLRERRIRLEEAEATRAREEATRLEGLPTDLATLETALGGREYAGIPYQVPASEMGGAEDVEGAALDPRGFRQPYGSTAEMLREHPGAARAAANVVRATKKPAFGAASAFGIKTVEQTQEELDRKDRKDQARTKKLEAVDLMAKKEPGQRAAGLLLFARALVDEEKLSPGEVKTIMELQASERGQEENDAFLVASRPVWSKLAQNKPLTETEQLDLAQALYEHRRAPIVARYFDEIGQAVAASESPIGKAGFRYAQLRMQEVPPKDAFATVFGENPVGAVGMMTLGEKYMPGFLKDDMRAAAKTGAQTSEEKDLAAAKLKTEQARGAEAEARTADIKARTTGRGQGGAKTVGEAQLNLDRARRALRDVDRDRSVDPEDKEDERDRRQGDVDYWQGELARLQGGGKGRGADAKDAEPTASTRTSEKTWGGLTPDQQKLRVQKVIARLKRAGKIREDVTSYEGLSAAEKQAVAAELR
jgi:hypothetical protein